MVLWVSTSVQPDLESLISFIMLNEHSTIGMTSSMVDSPNPMLTSYKLWKSIRLRNDLPHAKLGGDNILFINIKNKCCAGQNFEVMTFRYLKTLVFDRFFKKLQH